MVLSPQDIRNKEFSVKMRGYSIDEVNDFLDQVLKDYQITIDQNQELNNSLENTEKKLKKYENMKNSLNQSILIAQEAADNLKKDTQKKSDLIITKANTKAKSIVDDANKQAKDSISGTGSKMKSLVAEIEDLKKDAKLFRYKFQSILESQLNFVKNNEWDNLLNSNFSVDYQKIQESIQNLDKTNPYSVQSKGKSENNFNAKLATLIFYPDGSYKTIR